MVFAPLLANTRIRCHSVIDSVNRLCPFPLLVFVNFANVSCDLCFFFVGNGCRYLIS